MSANLPFYLTCFILWFSPIPLGANRPWAWGMIEALIAITSLLIVYCVHHHTILQRIKQSFLLLCVISFVQIWVFFQWIGSYYPELSFLQSLDPATTEVALIKGLSFCLFIINLAVVIDNKHRQKIVFKVMIASGLTQAIYAIFLQYSGWEYSPLGFKITDRANGSFVYHNHLAGYLVLCLSVAISYMIGSLKGMRAKTNKARLVSVIETMLSEKWILRIAIIIMVIALIMTRSRMGNSAFFVSLLITSVLALMLMKRPPNTLKWLVASLIILDIAIVGAYFGVDKVKERLEATSFQSETRDDVVTASIPYIQDYWLTGSGAGTFGSTFQSYQTYSLGGYYDHAHNEYVQFVVEFGLVHVLVMAVLWIYLFWNNVTILRTSTNRYRQGLAFSGLTAAIAVGLHISVDFILQNFAVVLLLLAALVLPNQTFNDANRSSKTQ